MHAGRVHQDVPPALLLRRGIAEQEVPCYFNCVGGLHQV